MKFYVSATSFLILSIMTVYLFMVSFMSAYRIGFWFVSIFILIIVLLLIYQLINEWKKIQSQKEDIMASLYAWTDVGSFMAVVTGTLIAFILSHQFGLGAVLASSIVGIIASLFFNKYEVPAFCGSFVGMACLTIFLTKLHIGLAGIIAGLLFLAAKQSFNGFGGKLGTIAFFGTWSASMLIGNPLQQGSHLAPELAQLIVIYSVMGALLTYIIKEKIKLSVVLSSSLVGFLGEILLPYIYPEFGGTLAIIFFCASFAGMSSVTRLPGEKYVAIAGLFSALIFIYSFPYFGGSGGKLGAIAFGSAIAAAGYVDLKTKLSRGRFF